MDQANTQPSSPTAFAWRTTQAIPALLEGELHIWRIDIPGPPGLLDRCLSCLTPEELSRANRRKLPRARHEFILGRGALRILLSAASGMEPQAVPLIAGPNEKPELPNTSLAFNVTHSAGVILIALRRNGTIGIDLEHINPTMHFAEVAASIFTPAENQHLTSIADPAQRRRAFYQLWTRKESVIKADGRGLTLPLSSFEIPSSSSQPIPVTISSKTFYVTDLPIEDTFAAAIALDTPADTTKLLLFPPQ
jgi:4'-phosphopantetheinyl transferase